MVECEKCLTWQHVVCVYGVNTETAIPEPYVCPDCKQQEPEEPSEDKEPAASEPTGASINDIEDKVRKSACVALQRILTMELVPKAIAKGVLGADIDAKAYAEALALKLENALYEHHAAKPLGKSKKPVDVGTKYRDHFRSLQFNLKGDKNEELQMRIVSEELTPDECVTLTVEQMLNPELRKLADEVRKEAIRESVLKVEDEAAPRVRKTHKGEEFVGDEPDLPELSENVTRTRTPPPSSEDATKTAANYERTQFDVTFSPPNNYSDSDGEPEPDSKSSETQIVPVWDGKASMPKVGEFPATAFHLGGIDFNPGLWSSIVNIGEPQIVSGRVDRATAFNYLETSSAKRLIASFVLISDEPAPFPEFTKVYEYHASRNKVGVLPNRSAIAKDAYLVPLAQSDEVPGFLGLDDAERKQLSTWLEKSPVLLGVFVLPNAKALAAACQNA